MIVCVGRRFGAIHPKVVVVFFLTVAAAAHSQVVVVVLAKHTVFLMTEMVR